jgi:hypothetical protein
MPQPEFRSPLQEFDRSDQAWCEPAALGHVFGCETLAPASPGPLRKVPERAAFDTQASEMREQRSPGLRHQTRSNSPSIHKITAFVVADQKRIESARSGYVSSDHELLTTIRPPLDPITGPSRAVGTASPFRDYALEPFLPDRTYELCCRDVEGLGVADVF